MNYSYNYINVPSTECRIQSFGKEIVTQIPFILNKNLHLLFYAI